MSIVGGFCLPTVHFKRFNIRGGIKYIVGRWSNVHFVFFARSNEENGDSESDEECLVVDDETEEGLVEEDNQDNDDNNQEVVSDKNSDNGDRITQQRVILGYIIG